MARRPDLFIRELSDGEAEHIHTFNGPITSSPAVAEHIVAVGSADGAIYAFDVPCGSDDVASRPRWTGATGGPVRSSPTIQDGVVYVGSDDGYLHALPSTAGWRLPHASRCGAAGRRRGARVSGIVNGLVYVGSV